MKSKAAVLLLMMLSTTLVFGTVQSAKAFCFHGVRVATRPIVLYLIIITGDMQPTLNRYEVVVVQGGFNGSEIYAAPKEADPPGDIIVFSGERLGLPGKLVVHRAISKMQDENGLWYFQTQGDANVIADPGYSKETELIGKVVAIIRRPVSFWSFWLCYNRDALSYLQYLVLFFWLARYWWQW